MAKNKKKNKIVATVKLDSDNSRLIVREEIKSDIVNRKKYKIETCETVQDGKTIFYCRNVKDFSILGYGENPDEAVLDWFQAQQEFEGMQQEEEEVEIKASDLKEYQDEEDILCTCGHYYFAHNKIDGICRATGCPCGKFEEKKNVDPTTENKI